MPMESVGHIRLTFKAYRDGNQWTAECLELGTASCADSMEGAFDALAEATELYLETLEDEGERQRVFAEREIGIIPGPPVMREQLVSAAVRPHEVLSRHEVVLPLSVA